MQALATRNAQHHDAEQARARALVRFNGLAFHSLAAASFLETAVPLHVRRLTRAFDAFPDVRVWLEQVWWPRRAERARQLREVVESTWPEFDWSAAYQEFYEAHQSRPRRHARPAGVAQEALDCCVVSAQGAVFYRALARSADLAALRALAANAARDCADSFDFFSALFERCKRRERIGIAAAWRAAIACCRTGRDEEVADAFRPIAGNWKGTAIVSAIDYPEFRERMARLVIRRAALGPVERMLFRPWLVRERAAPPAEFPVPLWLQRAPQAA